MRYRIKYGTEFVTTIVLGSEYGAKAIHNNETIVINILDIYIYIFTEKEIIWILRVSNISRYEELR